MADIMIDIETMGNTPTSAIVQIGAVAFERMTGEIKGRFLVNVDLNDEMKKGFTTDASTIEWWMGQKHKTWLVPIDKRHGTVKALTDLARWMRDNLTSGGYVWSHSTFDAPILSYHYNKMGMAMPVRYGRWLDLRTIGVMATGLYSVPKSERPEGAHDALVDAEYQAGWFSKCYRLIKCVDISQQRM